MTVSEVLSRVRISDVYCALTGITPRRAGRDKWRGPAAWRGGDNPDAVVLDDARGLWHDFVTSDGVGVLDLVQRVQGGNRADALRFVAELAGVVLDDRPASRAERRALAQRREREQQDMRAAEYFQFAAIQIAEHILDDVVPEAVTERYAVTQLRLSVRAAKGAALLAIYRDFCAREPRLTAGLVYAGKCAWARLCTRLARFVEAQDAA